MARAASTVDDAAIARFERASRGSQASATSKDDRAIDASSTAAPGGPCTLFQPGAERTAAEDCMRCHGMTQTHPVELDYAAAAARRPESYRRTDEVVRRGVFLPDGQIRCVTCHDPRSPWKDKIALPPGARAWPAVDLARPETFEPRRSRSAAPPALRPGSAVSPTPLCTSCHTYGD